jgi:hypothetical protein
MFFSFAVNASRVSQSYLFIVFSEIHLQRVQFAWRIASWQPSRRLHLCHLLPSLYIPIWYAETSSMLKQISSGNWDDPCVEAGSNTSTVTLRVVGGDEKGSLKSETVKYGLKSQGTRTWERLHWQGSAAHSKDRPDLSSERAPTRTRP